MDTLKYSDSGGRGAERGRVENGDDLGPSMEDIVLAMRQHLLTGETESGQAAVAAAAAGVREPRLPSGSASTLAPARHTTHWDSTNGAQGQANGQVCQAIECTLDLSFCCCICDIILIVFAIIFVRL